MARKDGIFLRGAVGPLVYRVVRGVQRVSIRPEPGTIKQTKATKASGKRLGMASSLGAEIRKTFEINVGTNFDASVNERLTGILIQVLTLCQDKKTRLFNFLESSFIKLENFNFNINALMNRITSIAPKVTINKGELSVQIDKVNINDQINFPTGASRCQITISMSLLRLKDGMRLAKAEKASVDFTKASKVLEAQVFTFVVPAGCLCLTQMTLKFSVAGKNGWEEVGARKANPSCIIGALITPGEYSQDSRRRWLKMVKFP